MSLFSPESIKKIETLRNCKYVCDTCLKNRDGGWVNFPVAIFYNEKAHPTGSNWMALYYVPELVGGGVSLRVADGISATEPFDGFELIDGTIAYSRHCHDFRSYNIGQKTFFIDGGRDYLRYGGDFDLAKRQVTLQIIKDKLEIIASDV